MTAPGIEAEGGDAQRLRAQHESPVATNGSEAPNVQPKTHTVL